MRHAFDHKPLTSRARSLVLLACGLAALCALALVGPSASGESLHDKLDKKQNRLSKVQQTKGVLTTTITHYSDRITGLQNQVAALQNQLAAVQHQLNLRQAELEQAQSRLKLEKAHLLVLRAHLTRALAALRERLVAIYESSPPDVLTVILQSHGWSDLISRTTYLSDLNDQNEALVGRVRDLRNQTRAVVDRLRAVRDRIKAARDAIASQKAELEQTRGSLNDRKGQLMSTRAKKRQVLDRVSRHEQELDGDVADLQAKIAARLAPQGALPAGPIQGGQHGLIWPVNGPIVSGYGPRTIQGHYEFHPGVDIAVPTGTPIRAAASGTVAFTEPESASGGYGNYTCIDHGGGLSTCYAHQESFAVSAGQTVSQGQVIGYSDCTGYCFGPHVHFEVRINGATTDPMAYL
jgi:peptidoglycan DL-endopeptidase CwlO